MPEFDTPTYYLDLEHSLNRATIESAKEGATIAVLVRSESDPDAAPIRATATRNGEGFFVVVETELGRQSFSIEWDSLVRDVNARRRRG